MKIFLIGLFLAIVIMQNVVLGDSEDVKIKFSFTERIRQESWDNINSLSSLVNDGPSYLRLKSLFKTSLNINQVELAFQIGNENRIYFNTKRDFKWNEIFIDQFYLKWPEILPKFTLTFGRQDVIFGEGFLFADGTPLDGSRSYYLNGLLGTYQLSSESKLHLFCFYQTREEQIMPLILDRNQPLEDQNTLTAGTYFETKFQKLSFEGYLFHKAMFRNENLLGSFNSNLNNAGFRINYPLTSQLKLTSEWALQFGNYKEQKSLAYGGYLYFTYQDGFSLPLPQKILLGLILLSGDDPESHNRHEGWDPAFSRWPKWSDSFVYVLAIEGGSAYWSNLLTPYLQLGFDLEKNAKVELLFYKLLAMKSTIETSYLSGTGKDRGELYIARFIYIFNAHFKGHVIYEHFTPGNFYIPNAAACNWLRFEMTFNF